jgi:hypothetical protein
MGNATKEGVLYWRCESRRPKVVQMVRDVRCRMQDAGCRTDGRSSGTVGSLKLDRREIDHAPGGSCDGH